MPEQTKLSTHLPLVPMIGDYQDGLNAGYDLGEKFGWAEGWDRGYESGHEQGLEDCCGR